MRLAKYLAERQETHEFRIKFAKEPSDEQLDKMEIHLRKYEAYDITSPKRTIMQPNPADFRNIKAAEVYHIDFKTHMPVSSYMLINELVQKMDIAERFIVVRNKREPLFSINNDEDESQSKYAEKTAKAKKENQYIVKLTDPEYKDADKIDVDKYAGEKFRDEFVKELNKTQVDLYTNYKGIK